MLTLSFLTLLLRLSTPEAVPIDQTFTGYFSRSMKIDTTSQSCGSNPNALLFKFQRDSANTAGNMFIYGLLKCPGSYSQSLFNYSKRVTITYRQWTRNDLENTEVLNKHKFFNVNFYLITSIQPED